ncbi:MAG: 23S rRNA (cytidine(2498)-2'-O)-methyltransferase RlmM [Oligoflexus sp.]
MSLLVYTRPGYESTVAGELNDLLYDWPGYTKPWTDLGFCELRSADGQAAAKAPDIVTAPIFARQWLNPAVRIEQLASQDRISPILDTLYQWLPEKKLRGFHIEHPDTNEGRELARFCKKFAGAFQQALKKSGFENRDSPGNGPWVHICFDSYETCFVGLRYHQTPPWAQGIPRLKMPQEAPSRSTLKLEEAFLRLLTEKERNTFFDLQKKRYAVDLGAAPGGWTYQLVRRGFQVTAIDNGSMQDELMATGMVEHLRVDAFHYRPPQAVDLLVCDMVEQPAKVTNLMEKWLTQKWCHTAIFNLKLPMKKKLAEVRSALERLQGLEPKILRASHLYHDRDEITVLLSLRSF